MSTNNTPHRRLNRLTGEWVLVSPQRMKRPWQGESKAVSHEDLPAHDPECYLCPRNERVDGARNPDYAGPHVFANDFPAMLRERGPSAAEGAFFTSQAVAGEAQVICYAPDHSLTLARIDDAGRRAVVDIWCDISADLGSRWPYVQIFENQGAMMGASSPHPHGQVWASDFIPTLVQTEDARQREHLAQNGAVLLQATVDAELSLRERIVAENADWLAVVPYWAAWPFETLVVARGDVRRLEQLSEGQRDSLSELLGRLLGAYDTLFDTNFPYSMGWHGAPHGLDQDTRHWRLHAHFFPPLLRSAAIRKHMVGYELMAETQRDLTPEAAAARLRELVR